MKLILFLSSLLTILTSEAASADPAVHDLAGDQLRRGVQYYILPVYRGRGGGLTLARRNAECPLNVGQESLEVVHGLPLTFSPVDATDDIVRLSTDVNVKFAAATICVQSTVWKLTNLDTVTGRRYVIAGGIAGSPGLGTVSSWFKIERYGNDYKLVFCPSVCKFCKVVCGDVGVFVEGGKRWLGLSDVPFPVMFKTAH